MFEGKAMYVLAVSCGCCLKITTMVYCGDWQSCWKAQLYDEFLNQNDNNKVMMI